ncbi:tyrosine-type recombinase/integrase [Escherichia coli]
MAATTVTRPVEASSARWEEIDMDAQQWTIPAGRMKMRRDHVIPLCSQAMAVLEAMKPMSHHREHVFPSRKYRWQPINSQTANAALRRMELLACWCLMDYAPYSAQQRTRKDSSRT